MVRAVLVIAGGVACRAPAPEAEPLPSAADLPAAPDPIPVELRLPASPVAERQPLPELHHRCQDPRFPLLAGDWLFGCDAAGRVELAERVDRALRVELSEPAVLAGAAPGGLYAMGRTRGTWRMPDPQPHGGWDEAGHPPEASPAFDGAHVAVSLEGRVAAFAVDEPVQRTRAAAPMPWFPPALAWPLVLWVDGRDQARSGLDIWAWDAGAGPPRPWVTRPGDQRHVAAGAGWAGWLDDEGVWMERLADGARWRHAADTGFRAGLSLWGGVACWEERRDGDIDARCSDGLAATGPGDQGWPSRSGPWLLVRDDAEAWLHTARQLLVEPGDPRVSILAPADGASPPLLRVTLPWPAPGWCAEAWTGAAWTGLGPLAVGPAVALEARAERLRLRPAAPDGACGPPEAA